MYPQPNIVTCTLRVWFREIGFSLTYGALMLKTWRYVTTKLDILNLKFERFLVFGFLINPRIQ